jgi:NAD(P)-dependent dehydrogenase (short-subunit alcohol dehydrogenase family)
MTGTGVPPVLVTGATGRIGRAVVDQLIEAGVPVRALIRREEAAATLPKNVEVVTGDLTVPESLTQAAQVQVIADVLGRGISFEELSPDDFRSETERSWPRPVVDMLLTAWEATMGRPAFVSSAVADILGSARTFRQWVTDHTSAFQ